MTIVDYGDGGIHRETVPKGTPVFELLDHRTWLEPSADDGDARAAFPPDRLFGPQALEHLVFHELRTYIDTRHTGWDLHYWRSTSQFEVDFILGGHTAIEVKATRTVAQRDPRGLAALGEVKTMRHLVLVSRDPTPRKVGSILLLPWQDFLERLWSDGFAA
ncbi:MAG: DUF4143 domain-containing protein [Deltaproteobacteria bacterium]|nr:DUF4143 domain-containing protein [Deltaproteobacteria bacterium]